mmetsp:Transcript_38461/g.94607  ORF Transcript_38461/g.94607 Transcript_38461/m.94607 type:complete len:82 (-) Transcript_38461:2382-2627(-)
MLRMDEWVTLQGDMETRRRSNFFAFSTNQIVNCCSKKIDIPGRLKEQRDARVWHGMQAFTVSYKDTGLGSRRQKGHFSVPQ